VGLKKGVDGRPSGDASVAKAFEYRGKITRSSLTSADYNSQSRLATLVGSTSREQRGPLMARACAQCPENPARHAHTCKRHKCDRKSWVDDGLPMFRVRTCRRKEPEAPDCERGVQLALGLASPGAGGKGWRKGDGDGGRVVPMVHN